MSNSRTDPGPSILRGPAIETETGVGALTLPLYLEELTDCHALREALVMHASDDTVTRWSYGELYHQATRVAKALVAAGLAKGEVVAVLATNRPEWLSSVFGIVMAGGIAAPLSTFSTPAELHCLLKASCASTLIAESQVLNKDFAAILHEMEPQIATARPGALASREFPFLRRVVFLGSHANPRMAECWTDFLASGDEIEPRLIQARSRAVAPCDPALLYFSSGSTGKPKGILNSHRGVALQCWRWARFIGASPEHHLRGWGANGFFWSGAFVQTVGATLSCGGCIVLQSTFNAEKALELIESERVTYIVCWPHQFAQLAEAPNWAGADLSSLHFVSCDTVIAKHPTVSTTWRDPYASYGSTETFTLSTCFPSGTPLDISANSHGTVLPGNTIRIVDPLTGEIRPRGEPGEIAVKGPTLMLGYLGMPLSDTLDDDGFFHTGDGGYVDERGRLFWEGRLNDIIKTGGANVSPLEIDAELMTIQGVKLSQTVGVPHDDLGEMIVACVVAAEGNVLEEDMLRDRLKQRLASYKVPRRFLFVAPEDLDFTGSAKVRTAALRDFAAKRLGQAS